MPNLNGHTGSSPVSDTIAQRKVLFGGPFSIFTCRSFAPLSCAAIAWPRSPACGEGRRAAHALTVSVYLAPRNAGEPLQRFLIWARPASLADMWGSRHLYGLVHLFLRFALRHVGEPRERAPCEAGLRLPADPRWSCAVPTGERGSSLPLRRNRVFSVCPVDRAHHRQSRPSCSFIA